MQQSEIAEVCKRHTNMTDWSVTHPIELVLLERRADDRIRTCNLVITNHLHYHCATSAIMESVSVTRVFFVEDGS